MSSGPNRRAHKVSALECTFGTLNIQYIIQPRIGFMRSNVGDGVFERTTELLLRPFVFQQ